MRRNTSLALFVLLVFLASSAIAQSATSCSHHAWLTDTDPKGLNIRKQPSVKSSVIAKIPLARDDGEQTIVEVVGYTSGWLKIKFAETVDGNMLLNGIGWVAAKMATVNTERQDGNSAKSVNLYSLASSRSKVVATIPNEVTVRLIGFDCFGFKVEYKGKSGWLSASDMCGNPVTTCP